MISGYYCNGCAQVHLEHLKTGNLLATSHHSGSFKIHTTSRPGKPINGIFFNTGADYYNSGGRQIGKSGIVEVQTNGGLNAYLDFGTQIGRIECSGITSGASALGKAVLINNPIHVHRFPATGFGSASGSCAVCRSQLFPN
jgi:hypothetical protein